MRNKNVCSAFFRLHPILNDNFKQIFQPEIFTDNGETVSVDLKLSAVEGGRRRVEAKTSYYFERTYFEDLSKLGDRIHLCIVEKEEQIASICLFLECGGIAQAHLGGSKTEFLSESPFSLVFDYGRYWAKERRNEFFHIGGGVGGSNQDHLYIFKSGFSKTKHKFLTLKLILDNDKYYDLVELKAKSLRTTPEEILKSKIFPAYRSS